MAKTIASRSRVRNPFLKWLEEQSSEVRQAYKNIKRLRDKERPQDLAWWHALGEQVLLIHPADSKGRYGKHFVESLARQLAPKAPGRYTNVFYRARQIAVCLGSEKARELTKKISAPGSHLSLRHVFHLASLGPKDFPKFLKRCETEGWPTHRVEREIQNHRGYRRSAGGHRVSPPAAPCQAAAIRDITILCRRWTAYGKVWLEGKKAVLRQRPARDEYPALQKELERVCELLPAVSETLGEVQKALKTLAKLVSRK